MMRKSEVETRSKAAGKDRRPDAPKTRGATPTKAVTIRMTDETHDRLEAFRRQLELAQPFGRVTAGEALRFAVSSASASLADRERCGGDSP